MSDHSQGQRLKKMSFSHEPIDEKRLSSRALMSNNDVEKIGCLHKAMVDAARLSLEKAIEIGEILLLARKKCRHGDWAQFVIHQLPFGERTATNYIRLAKNKESFKSEIVSDLNLADAYRLTRKKTAVVSGSLKPITGELDSITFVDGTPIDWPTEENLLITRDFVAQEILGNLNRRDFRSVVNTSDKKRAQDVMLKFCRFLNEQLPPSASETDKDVFEYVLKTCLNFIIKRRSKRDLGTIEKQKIPESQ